MFEPNPVIIDAVSNITVDRSKFNNEMNKLEDIAIGIKILYETVKNLEKHIQPGDFGAFFVLTPEQQIVPSIYHWFSISMINYVRLTGLIIAQDKGIITSEILESNIKKDRDLIKEQCDEYVKSISEIKAVLAYRHKVGAHLAITFPKKEDNFATLQASLMPDIQIYNQRFHTGQMMLGQGDCQSEMPKFSLTEVVEKIGNRFPMLQL